jgi:HAD superfamily hydrolase (TIGR01490 family)
LDELRVRKHYPLENEMRSCAIFDLDGTIIDSSSERIFLKYLVEHGELPIRNLLRWTFDFIRLWNLREAKANKVYLRGLPYAHICELARVCFSERLVHHISPKVYELIDFHRAHGRAIVILSGSLELLVERFRDWLGADLMIGYKLEAANGLITGRRIGLNPYGENKAILAQQLAEEHGFDLNQSYAYGNHHSDAHKLKLIGRPVAVNPDGKLRRIAENNGWRITQFHE